MTNGWNLRQCFHFRLENRGIELITYQNDDTVDINPQKEDDDTADGAVKRIVIGEISDIVVETDGSDDEQQGKHNCSWCKQSEFPVFIGVSEVIKHRDGDKQHKHCQQPASYFYQCDNERVIKMDIIEKQWQIVISNDDKH